MARFDRLIDWKSLTVEQIAKAFHQVTGGNKRKLNHSERYILRADSVWGQVVQEIIPGGVNCKQDRKLLQSFWAFNRKHVQEHYNKIDGRRGLKVTNIVPDPKDLKFKPCLCEKFYHDPDGNQFRIECDTCHRWYHQPCTDLDVLPDVSFIPFVCFHCSDFEIPAVFDETDDSDIDNVEGKAKNSSQPVKECKSNKDAIPDADFGPDDHEFHPLSVCATEMAHIDGTIETSIKHTDDIKPQSEHFPIPDDLWSIASSQHSAMVKSLAKKASKKAKNTLSKHNKIRFSRTDGRRAKQDTKIGATPTTTSKTNQLVPKCLDFSSNKISKCDRDTKSDKFGLASATETVQENPDQLSGHVHESCGESSKTSSSEFDEVESRISSKKPAKSSKPHTTTVLEPEIITTTKADGDSSDFEDVFHEVPGDANIAHERTCTDRHVPHGNETKVPAASSPTNSKASVEDDDFKPKTKKKKKHKTTLQSNSDDEPDESKIETPTKTKKKKKKTKPKEENDIPATADEVQDADETAAQADSTETLKKKKKKSKKQHKEPSVAEEKTEQKSDEKSQHTQKKSPIFNPFKVVKDKKKQARRLKLTREDLDPEGKIDTSNVKERFKFRLPIEELQKLIYLRKGTSGKKKADWVLPTTHRKVLSEEFDKTNKVCVLGFNNKAMNPPGSRGNFYIAYAYCSRFPCTATFALYIKEKPRDTASTFTVRVRKSRGEIEHYKDATGGRLMDPEDRKRFEEILMHNKPAKVFYENAANHQTNAKMGKRNDIYTNKTFQRIKEKAAARKDLHSDVAIDLMLTVSMLKKEYPDKDIPGYMQEYQYYPFNVTMYTKTQLEIFHEMTKKSDVPLLFDATGGLVTPLGATHSDKQINLYTILAMTEKGLLSLPILEFLTNDGTYAHIFSVLLKFFTKYKLVFNVKKKLMGILKFETDFSRALYMSIIQYFENKSVEAYVNDFWEYYIQNPSGDAAPLNVVVVHICKFHVRKFMTEKAADLYSRYGKINSDTAVPIITQWIDCILVAEDLFDFHRRVKDIGILCLSKTSSESVQNVCTNMRTKTKRSARKLPWRKFKPVNERRNPLWYQSFWGQYAYSIFQEIEKNAEEGDENDDVPNPYYCPGFVKYLQVSVLPYFSMLSYLCFTACGFPPTCITNNEIEGYQGLLKNNFYENRNPQKAGRFIREQAKIVTGISNVTSLANDERRSKNKSVPFFREPKGSKRNVKEDTCIGRELPADMESSIDGKDGEESDIKRTELDDDEVEVLQTPLTKEGRRQKCPPPESATDKWKKKIPRRTVLVSETQSFQRKVPHIPWGGLYKLNEDRPMRDTCNFDTSLQLLTAMFLSFSSAGEFLNIKGQDPDHQYIIQAIRYCTEHKFAAAKTVWIKHVLKKRFPADGSFWGTEFDHAFVHVGRMFPLKLFHSCGNESCRLSMAKMDPVLGYELSSVSELTFTSPQDFEDKLSRFGQAYPSKCACGLQRWRRIELLDDNVPIIPYFLGGGATESDIPRHQSIRGTPYKCFGYTCFINQNHFVAKFIVGSKIVVYDGLKETGAYEEKIVQNNIVSSVWLVRADICNSEL